MGICEIRGISSDMKLKTGFFECLVTYLASAYGVNGLPCMSRSLVRSIFLKKVEYNREIGRTVPELLLRKERENSIHIGSPRNLSLKMIRQLSLQCGSCRVTSHRSHS